jgi:signal transduction histidine kinase
VTAAGERLLDALERDYPLDARSDLPAARVIRTHETLFLREMRPAALRAFAPDERYAEIVAALAPCSGIVVPLLARGRALGALVLAMAAPEAGGSGRRFSEDDMRTAESLAERAALALDSLLLLGDAERSRAAAEDANRAKSAFLAAMSHELRTPLNAIAGYVELIDMGLRGPVTEAQREDLARIQRSQQHLLGLITDVLNFVRLDTGHVRYEIEDVPLGAALQRVEELVLPQLHAKGLRYERPPCDPSVTVRADAEKLRQIVVNLLTNATKFTDAGGRIEVRWAVADALVRIEVRDSGVGIPPERLEQVFDPFVQVGRQLNRPAEGVGLGLAISRDLARHMGGDVTAASEVGAGSTFTITLPRGVTGGD